MYHVQLQLLQGKLAQMEREQSQVLGEIRDELKALRQQQEQLLSDDGPLRRRRRPESVKQAPPPTPPPM